MLFYFKQKLILPPPLCTLIGAYAVTMLFWKALKGFQGMAISSGFPAFFIAFGDWVWSGRHSCSCFDSMCTPSSSRNNWKVRIPTCGRTMGAVTILMGPGASNALGMLTRPSGLRPAGRRFLQEFEFVHVTLRERGSEQRRRAGNVKVVELFALGLC